MLPVEVLVDALHSGEHVSCLARCKALAALADFPAFTEVSR